MKKRYVGSTLIFKIFVGSVLIISNFMMVHFAKWNVFIFLWLNTLINFAGTHILFKDMLQNIKSESKDIIVKKVDKNTFFDYIMLLMFLLLNILFNYLIFINQTKSLSAILFNASLYVAVFVFYQFFKRKGRYIYTVDGYTLDFCLIQGSIATKEFISALVGEKVEILDDNLNKVLWILIIGNLIFDVMIYIEFYSNNQSINKENA